MEDRLIIFDTTLRDGEQSPGASMTGDEKMRIARQLERLKVDVIEAGFPVISDGDFTDGGLGIDDFPLYQVDFLYSIMELNGAVLSNLEFIAGEGS